SEWIQTTLMTTRLAALRSDDGSFAVQTWEKSTDVPKGTTYDFPVERSGLPLGLCSRDGATVELNLH
ncbi:MAG TPA: hypothetical protein VMU70_00360, partial [Candidatus Tyrphobacter sp.]|nr:hypothetical protein [Candidatus Tyrphobacter sp.]